MRVSTGVRVVRPLSTRHTARHALFVWVLGQVLGLLLLAIGCDGLRRGQGRQAWLIVLAGAVIGAVAIAGMVGLRPFPGPSVLIRKDPSH